MRNDLLLLSKLYVLLLFKDSCCILVDIKTTVHAPNLQLQLQYHGIFTKYCHVIKMGIDVNKSTWMKDLPSIIEEEDLQNIDFELDNAEKVVKIVDYLIKKNSVVIYKKFIEIWKTHDEAIAKQFEINLKKVIDNAGLTAENEKVQIVHSLGKLS